MKLDCWKDGFGGFFEDEAETTAEVNLGNDFAISMLADFEASLDVFSASSSRSSLSKSFSIDNGEERRAFLWLSDKDDGKSFAKCSLLRRRRNANMDEDKVIVSTIELPKNLLMASNRLGSTGSKSVLLISFDRTSSIQLTKDWVACRP